MRRRRNWLKGSKDSLTLFFALLLSLVMMLSDNGMQTQMIRIWSFAGFGLALEKYAAVKQLLDIYDQNKQLRERNASLMLENSQLKEAAIQNSRLRALLAFKERSELALVPAQVIGRKQSGLVNVLLLDSGRADSIEVNMAVVTSEGLVGKVYTATEDVSTVQILPDRNIRVSALVQRSRVRGIIRWNENDRLALEQVPKRSDIRIGDTIVTSPLSSIFPAGLKIGRVVDVSETEFDMFVEVAVEPFVDFGRLEEAFVIRTARAKL